jgi:hypothetical protein
MAKKEALTEIEVTAEKMLNSIANGNIERFLNADLAAKILRILTGKNENIIMITEGELQYFIDKTNITMREELSKILMFQMRTGMEVMESAKAALNTLTAIKSTNGKK